MFTSQRGDCDPDLEAATSLMPLFSLQDLVSSKPTSWTEKPTGS